MSRAADKHPFMMIRLWPEHHRDPALLEELLRLLKRHRASCDEVWFCTEPGYPSMDVHRDSAQKMQAAAERMRTADILPGVQIANTLGHMDCLFEVPGGDW